MCKMILNLHKMTQVNHELIAKILKCGGLNEIAYKKQNQN